MAKTKKISELHLGHRERLRARFIEEGLENFAEHEVLELLLFNIIPRANTNPLAHKLIQRFGSLSKILDADTKDLKLVAGIGDKAAVFLNMLRPLTARYLRSSFNQKNPSLNNPEVVADFLRPLMLNRMQEVFYVISLNSKCQVLHATLIAEGTVNQAHVYPRKVVEAAIRHKAASIILAHNHPAGSLIPSESDIRLTRKLVAVMTDLDIPVLDHVIIAQDKSYSFAESGHI